MDQNKWIGLAGLGLEIAAGGVLALYPTAAWIGWGLLILGGALLLWAIYGWFAANYSLAPPRLRKKNEDEFPLLLLRTHGDHRPPVELERIIVWRWYFLQNVFQFMCQDGTSGEAKLCTLFILFERDVRIGQVLVSSDDFILPVWEVKDKSSKHVIISFNGNVPAGKIKIVVDESEAR